MYKLLFEKDGSVIQGFVKNVEAGTVIPFDPANTDYQEYLKWLAEGNEPLPADE